MAVIAPVPGASIDPVALSEFLAARMPYFMVPRYIRVLPNCPRHRRPRVSEGRTAQRGDNARYVGPREGGERLKKEKL
jgi:crotonobetaine/carnitine-CoA ligase